MENVNSELLGNLLGALALIIPAIIGGYALRDVLARKDVNRQLEKAYDSVPPSIYKDTVRDIIALADKNSEALISVVEKHNAQVAEVLRQVAWWIDYAEDVTDGEDEDAVNAPAG